MVVKRKIIEIDESLCNGCGQCVLDCAEGAIRIIGGKAKLISDNLCDGLGACMGGCPEDALQIIEREADDFDEDAVKDHLKKEKNSCSSLKMTPGLNSAGLSSWPVQISLISPDTDKFNGEDLLIAADCTAFTYKKFHEDIVQGKKFLIGCPKLDDSKAYINKLSSIFSNNDIKSLTIARMDVPCCSGLEHIIKKSFEKAGKDIFVNVVTISRTGDLI